MDFLMDWNCGALPSLAYDKDAIRSSTEMLDLLYLRYHISRFCMMTEWNATRDPISVHLLHRETATRTFIKALPSHIEIKTATQVRLVPGLHKMEGLERLLLTRSGYLPLQLPLAAFEEWMDEELNRLLYHRRLRLLFTSFDLCSIFYSEDATKRLLSVPGAVYQFNYKALQNERLRQQISGLLERNDSSVLLGTSLDSFSKAMHYEADLYLKAAADGFSPADYQRLMHQSRAFWSL